MVHIYDGYTIVKIPKMLIHPYIMSDDDNDWVQSDAIVDDDWDVTPPPTPPQSPRELKELAIAVQKALSVEVTPIPVKPRRRVHCGM